jgi:zinc protease
MSARMRGEPAALAANRLSRALSPYPPDDVRYVPTADENAKRMESVTLAQVIELYQKQIGATQGELAIVGDFDFEPTLFQIRAILKDWKAEVPYRRIARLAPTRQTGAKENILTPDKANADFRAGLAFELKETSTEYAALRLGNFILGGGTLSSRLGNRIRQKEGLSYGVTSAITVSPLDPSGTFTITAITNPLNIDRVEKAALEEVTEFRNNGPTTTELKDAQKAYLEAQKVSRTSDGAIAGQIAANLRLGRTFSHAMSLEKRIEALTPEEVKAAFQRFIDPKKLVIIRAGDFKK